MSHDPDWHPCLGEDLDHLQFERRKHRRTDTSAHVMVKIGLDGTAYGLGTIRQISRSGLLVETDLVRDMGIGRFHHYIGHDMILHGSEAWNRRFFIMAKIVRVADYNALACSISSVSSREFLEEWVALGGTT